MLCLDDGVTHGLLTELRWVVDLLQTCSSCVSRQAGRQPASRALEVVWQCHM